MTEQSEERRRFSRIPFTALAHLKSYHDTLFLNCKVHDVSLKGILISRPDDWDGRLHDHYKINLVLEDSNIIIRMEAAIAHIDEQYIGFECELIDLESISRLKRLVELNLGDESLLQRELHVMLEYR